MSALNTQGSTITVVLGGTAVPLPDEQSLDGFTVNGTDTVFTVPETGRYLVTYNVATTAALLLSSRVMLNGAELLGTTVAPAASISSFSATRIVSLTAGDTLELQLFNFAGAAVLQGGTGASLNVVRLS